MSWFRYRRWSDHGHFIYQLSDDQNRPWTERRMDVAAATAHIAEWRCWSCWRYKYCQMIRKFLHFYSFSDLKIVFFFLWKKRPCRKCNKIHEHVFLVYFLLESLNLRISFLACCIQFLLECLNFLVSFLVGCVTRRRIQIIVFRLLLIRLSIDLSCTYNLFIHSPSLIFHYTNMRCGFEQIDVLQWWCLKEIRE